MATSKAVARYCPSCGAANTLIPPLPEKIKCFWCDNDFEPAKPTSKPYRQSLKAMQRSQRCKDSLPIARR
jgi:hypothetical protein